MGTKQKSKKSSKLESISTEDLCVLSQQLSHLDSESDERWDQVRELRKRDPLSVFAFAKKLSGSDIWQDRELAADLLVIMQVDGKELHFPVRRESKPLLKRLLEDKRPEVTASVLFTCKHLRIDFGFSTKWAHLARSKNEWIRYAMVHAMDTEDPASVPMLIDLMIDEDSNIRDWATFALGTLCDFDSPEIRNGLAHRLYDEHDDTHMEAVIGLAKRHDERALQPILECFEEERKSDDWMVGRTWLEAAGYLAEPALLRYLEDMTEWREDSIETLQWAICRCKGELADDAPNPVSLPA